MSQQRERAAEKPRYRVRVGLNYRPNGFQTLPEKRVEPGAVVDDLPPMAAIETLIAQGVIARVEE